MALKVASGLLTTQFPRHARLPTELARKPPSFSRMPAFSWVATTQSVPRMTRTFAAMRLPITSSALTLKARVSTTPSKETSTGTAHKASQLCFPVVRPDTQPCFPVRHPDSQLCFPVRHPESQFHLKREILQYLEEHRDFRFRKF